MRLRASDTAHRETEKQSSKSMIGRLSNHGSLQLIPCVFCVVTHSWLLSKYYFVSLLVAAETVLLLLLLSALLALRASVNRVKIKTKALSISPSSIWAGGKKTPIDTAGQRRMDPRAAHANSFVGIQHPRWALTAAQRPTDSPRPRPPLAASDWPPGPSPPGGLCVR
jgi:hypothetical protein